MESNSALDIIDYLKSKPFVHIISEPRTGSSSLYSQIQDTNDFDFDLNEPFENFETGESDVDPDIVISYLENNLDKCKVMKNHARSITKLNFDQQKKIFNLPSFSVLLTRNNWFEQICSLALAETTRIFADPHDHKLEISIQTFKQCAFEIFEAKYESSKYINSVDLILSYENLVFKNHKNKQNNKHYNITNLDDLYRYHLQTIKQSYNFTSWIFDK